MVSIVRTKCCHIPIISASDGKAVIFFDVSWSRKKSVVEFAELLNVVHDAGLQHIYHIADEFCEEVESFVIQKGAKTFPNVSVIIDGKMTHFSSVSEDISGVQLALQAKKVIGLPPVIDPPSVALPSLVKGVKPPQSVRLFISGDKSSVGKSTCCLYLLASLIHCGVNPRDLAYIKPITQCEAEQPVTKYCNKVGISNRGVGPVVFYKGFTRAFLNGDTDTSEQLLASVVESVEEIEQGKKIVLIDGVGYPAVGSICGISNADAAKALNASVLLIGKSGVGDAVDSFNLNCRFFECAGVRVLGGIFNKIALEGYYNVESCRTAVTSYFKQHSKNCKAYGFIPTMPISDSDDHNEIVSPDFLQVFSNSVSVRDIIHDALYAQYEDDCHRLSGIVLRRKYDMPISFPQAPQTLFHGSNIPAARKETPLLMKKTISDGPRVPSRDNGSTLKPRKRSRADIEADARKKGAKGG